MCRYLLFGVVPSDYPLLPTLSESYSDSRRRVPIVLALSMCPVQPYPNREWSQKGVETVRGSTGCPTPFAPLELQ